MRSPEPCLSPLRPSRPNKRVRNVFARMPSVQTTLPLVPSLMTKAPEGTPANSWLLLIVLSISAQDERQAATVVHRQSPDFNYSCHPLLRRALATHDHDGEHGDKQHTGDNPDNDR